MLTVGNGDESPAFWSHTARRSEHSERVRGSGAVARARRPVSWTLSWRSPGPGIASTETVLERSRWS